MNKLNIMLICISILTIINPVFAMDMSSAFGNSMASFGFLILIFIILSIALLIYAPRFCGAMFILVGFFLTLTIIGAIIGVPLMLIGAILILSGGKRKLGDVNVIQHVSQHAGTQKDEDDSLSILKKRYAKGEVTKKEYKEMKDELEDKKHKKE